MDELINDVIAKLGLDEEVTRKAIGQVLSFLKKSAAGVDFDFWGKILSKLQGADLLIDKANEPISRSSSKRAVFLYWGSILKVVAWMLGLGSYMAIFKRILSLFVGKTAVRLIDSAGDGALLASKLYELGISKDKGTTLTNMLISFMKQKAGQKVVDELIDEVPILKTVIGIAKKVV